MAQLLFFAPLVFPHNDYHHSMGSCLKGNCDESEIGGVFTAKIPSFVATGI
jgi:hypothetical protein